MLDLKYLLLVECIPWGFCSWQYGKWEILKALHLENASTAGSKTLNIILNVCRENKHSQKIPSVQKAFHED